jgi:hypothetical protein
MSIPYISIRGADAQHVNEYLVMYPEMLGRLPCEVPAAYCTRRPGRVGWDEFVSNKPIVLNRPNRQHILAAVSFAICSRGPYSRCCSCASMLMNT